MRSCTWYKSPVIRKDRWTDVSAASQPYHCHITIGGFDSIGAMHSGTPAHISVALDERIGDQVLILATDFVDEDQIEDCFIIDENVTFART